MPRIPCVALLLFAALIRAQPLYAQIVTVHGAGSVDTWYTVNTGTGDIPAVLLNAFEPVPGASPFTARMSYDTRLVTDVSGIEYFRPITSLSLLVSGHTIVADVSSPLNIVYVYDQPSLDRVVGLVYGGRIDGVPDFAGYRVAWALVGLSDTDATALSTSALPDVLCLADWEQLSFDVAFIGEDVLTRQYVVSGHGVPDRSIDSDGDSLTDQTEFDAGTNPCNTDTDGDTLNDATDPEPLEPQSSTDVIAIIVRETANDVLEVPESNFAAPNAAAQRGRRNALANQLQSAANAIEAGNLEEALSILEHVRDRLDGNPVPPDAMEDGPAKDALRAEIDALIALVRAQLGA